MSNRRIHPALAIFLAGLLLGTALAAAAGFTRFTAEARLAGLLYARHGVFSDPIVPPAEALHHLNREALDDDLLDHLMAELIRIDVRLKREPAPEGVPLMEFLFRHPVDLGDATVEGWATGEFQGKFFTVEIPRTSHLDIQLPSHPVISSSDPDETTEVRVSTYVSYHPDVPDLHNLRARSAFFLMGVLPSLDPLIYHYLNYGYPRVIHQETAVMLTPPPPEPAQPEPPGV